MNFRSDREQAAALDAADDLASYRSQFHLPSREGAALTYLCGHSLGLQPRAANSLVQEELLRWQTQAVEAHFDGPRPWLSYHELLTPGLSELTGALSTEVVAMNSLTVNLHLMLTSFYKPSKSRWKILIERNAFPSDRYAVVSQLRLHGLDSATSLLEATPRAGEHTIRTEDLLALIEREGATLATVLLPGVQYLSGQLFDLQVIAAAAQKQGAVVGFDLAHAIGNAPLRLHEWNVDFAVWCGYKYLNGGPGAIGGCFVHERHARRFDLPRLAGWWGHDKASRFDMPADFKPIAGVEGWQLSNPPILACAPLLASLQLFQAAGIEGLRSKSLQLGGYLQGLLKELADSELEVLTPTRPEARGSQISLRLRRSREKAQSIHRSLGKRGFICDWREPDVIRVAPVPLYNSFADVWSFCAALAEELSANA